MAQRSKLDTWQFVDVGFEDICENPMAVVRRIYAYFDYDLSSEAESLMARYIDRRPRYLFGEHIYAANDFGLADKQYADLFSDYRHRYSRFLS